MSKDAIQRRYLQLKLSRMARAADDSTTKNAAQVVGYLEAVNELRAWLKDELKRSKGQGGVGR